MLTGFIIGMLTMYFIINLYYGCIAFNSAPTEFKDVRKVAWFEFWMDFFFGIYLTGILHKISCLTKWNIIMKQQIEKNKEKLDAEK